MAFNDTISVAKKLLGALLIHESPEGRTVGRIVETEAYLSNDPGSHSFRGRTPRNEQMFGPPGKAYVYFIYGMYHCFNVVTAANGVGEAVLIRALEPVEGISLMKKRRKTEDVQNLCNGPSKLVMAMGITKEHNGHDLKKGCLRIKMIDTRLKIVTTTRIGIKEGAKLPYRFYVKDCEYVSKK